MKEKKEIERKKVERLESRFYSVAEVARVLGLSEKTVYNMTGRKSKRPFPVKPKRIGRLVKFDRQDVDRYIGSL